MNLSDESHVIRPLFGGKHVCFSCFDSLEVYCIATGEVK